MKKVRTQQESGMVMTEYVMALTALLAVFIVAGSMLTRSARVRADTSSAVVSEYSDSVAGVLGVAPCAPGSTLSGTECY